jgi:hypothetical protein
VFLLCLEANVTNVGTALTQWPQYEAQTNTKTIPGIFCTLKVNILPEKSDGSKFRTLVLLNL